MRTAMRISMKGDAKSHRFVSLGKSRRLQRPMACAEGTGSSKIELGLASGHPRPFVEDFYFEHSCSGVSTTQIAISASSDFVVAAASGKLRKCDLSSPNCVYLG
jgi:hypothetical protein